MGKKIEIKQPGQQNEEKLETANEWVSNREGSKRLTVDLPASLHSCLKIQAVKLDIPMASLVKQAIENMLDISGQGHRN